jgi:hypothetical protein
MYVFIIYIYMCKESMCMEYMEFCSRGAESWCDGMRHVPSEASFLMSSVNFTAGNMHMSWAGRFI